MKRRLSIKLKLTLWFTGFMTLLAALCLGIILLVSDSVSRRETENILSLSVRSNIAEVTLKDGTLNLSSDFQFYVNDAYMLIYNKNKSLLTGQAPPSFPIETVLENGVTKFIYSDGDRYCVTDFWIPSGWNDGVWLRGVLKTPDGTQIIDRVFAVFFIILPFFIFSAALGGYLIAKRTLNPISHITEVAGKISEGQDLTQRIGLPDGRDEVSRLSSAFDHMFARLEKSFEAEKQFTSDASHELRTPTAVILAQCSFAKKHADSPEEYAEAIDVIERQAKKMSLLIGRLLDMTRLDLGTQKIRRETVDLSEMARVLCEEQDTGVKNISIHRKIEDKISIQADPLLLSRVITNLLDNARQYGKENGNIFLTLTSESDKAVLQVRDDGIGIAPEHQEKIWQRFYQVNPSRGTDAGLGLGLAMIRQIVQLHGGTISLQSKPGEGSCFTVSLPLK